MISALQQEAQQLLTETQPQLQSQPESQSQTKTEDSAYSTMNQEFEKFLNANKNETLEKFIEKVSKEWGIDQIFPKEKIDSIRDELPVINNYRTYEELAKLDGQVVRYFCFVQDILESEMQIGLLMKRHDESQTVENYLKTNKIFYLNYRDTYDNKIFDEFDLSEDIVLFDRNNVVCTPIPYQNEWLSTSFLKKPREETEGTKISSKLQSFYKNKGTVKGFREEDFNSGSLCLVKFYDKLEGKISLNQVIEVIGIFQYQIEPLQKEGGQSNQDEGEFQGIESIYPSSLIPRIHTITCTKLDLPTAISKKSETKPDSKKAKTELVALLNHIIGDEKISTVLLMNLISKIIFKKDLDIVGKLTLNLLDSDQIIKVIKKDGQEEKHELIDLLYSVIQKLLPFSSKLDLSIKNLSELSFKPQKDHNLNCLNRGILQMANETLILIDENKLESGTLGDKAVRNLQALQHMVQNQSLSYDFVYYDTTIDTDVKTLIASKGKSLLHSDIQKKIPIQDRFIKEEDDIYTTFFGEGLKWDLYRAYLANCGAIVGDIQIPSEISDVIRNDYSAECKTNTKLKPELFNQRLTISRYLAALEGKESIDFDTYKISKEFDE